MVLRFPLALDQKLKSLETLTMEHALLGRGLGALEIVARMERDGVPVPEETTRRLLAFFETFGDRYHHIKEEHVLIPRLEEGCGSRARCRSGAMIGEVLYEHEVGRRLLAKLQLAATGLGKGAGAREAFAVMADDYIAFLRNHIVKEKNRLLRSASWKLPEEDEALLKSFDEHAQREEIGATAREFAAEIDGILAELSIRVPAPTRRAYSRGSIPYHRGRNVGPITF